jgi:hypothetical protein
MNDRETVNPAPPNGKVGVREITITRREGQPDLDKRQTAASYEEADRVLLRMAHTAPDTGGYDKVAFVIAFDDGQTYAGRFALKRTGNLPLGEHVTRTQAFAAGRWHPAHISEDLYQAFLRREGEERQQKARRFLDTYDTGGP